MAAWGGEAVGVAGGGVKELVPTPSTASEQMKLILIQGRYSRTDIGVAPGVGTR